MSKALIPRPMPTPDLAGLLGRPSRPNTQPATQRAVDDVDAAAGFRPSAVAPETESQVVQPEVMSDQARNDGRGDVAPTAALPTRQFRRPRVVYLPRSIFQALAERAQADNTTRTALLLNAVNATHPALAEALVADAAQWSVRAAGDLFDVPQSRRPAEPTVQTTVRLTDHQLQVLDDLSAQHRTNRSKLLTVALQLYLATAAARPRPPSK